jgi:hypothetical protein
MTQAIHSVVGSIRIEPLPEADSRSDDASLGQLLGSLAQQRILGDWSDRPGLPARLVSSRRISACLPAATGGVMRADLARLLDDLQAEYDQLEAAIR